MEYNTQIITIEEEIIEDTDRLKKHRALIKGAGLLKKGETVAFPTETVYGLGADATRPEAVARIFTAKGRPQDNPLIVHVGERQQFTDLVSGRLSRAGEILINAFWPGPLTIIVERSPMIPPETTAGLDSVAIRMPSHPVARVLIKKAGLPIAAPSANSSGYPSPTRADHVYQDLNHKIPLIIDGGPCPVGIESTVIDITDSKPRILRPGGVATEEIEKILGSEISVEGKVESDETPPSPGMKYRHYSPGTPLMLFKQEDLNQIEKIFADYQRDRVIMIMTEETATGRDFKDLEVVTMGTVNDLKTVARNLFALIREADSENYDLILVEEVPEKGLGQGVMNRLHRAARENIYF